MHLDPYILFLLGVGVIVLLVAWLPLALRNLPLSLAILCVAAGVVIFQAGGLSFRPNPLRFSTLTEKLTELVVIVSLMGAGLKIDRRIGLKAWSSSWRLIAITMPLTIAGVTLMGVYGLGLGLASALLLGAVLAPTDPVLASDVQVGPPRSGEDGEARFALTSEAGLNDGFAFPFVHLAVALARSGRDVLIIDQDQHGRGACAALGLTPRYDVADVLEGRCTLDALMLNGPDNVQVLPIGGGFNRLGRLSERDQEWLAQSFNRLQCGVDVVLVDMEEA
ncbi:MAG: hypothetical protein B7Y78_13270, partial [Caulobacter sp. 35-67-4]